MKKKAKHKSMNKNFKNRMNIFSSRYISMATANINKDDNGNDHEQWQAAQTIHDQHQWNDSSDDDEDKNDVDNHEFFDAHDTEFTQNQTSTITGNPDVELLHERLNANLSMNEEAAAAKKKSPG